MDAFLAEASAGLPGFEREPKRFEEDLGPGKDKKIFDTPIVMDPFFRGSPRYRVAKGGRGSVKSWSIARMLVLIAHSKKRKRRILCGREYQKSIRESVHFLLRSQIERLGLDEFFTTTDTRIVSNVTGSEFLFVGLHHNVESIKSMEAIDICWIEEAETVSQESWDTLDPTIRAEGSEIWISYNPKDETDPIHKMFGHPNISQCLPGTARVEVGWGDNPWLPEVLRTQAEWMREHDYERYEHIWGGTTWFQNEAQVLNGRWRVKDFETAMTGRPNISGPYLGIDFGFSQDPGAAVKSFVELLNPEDFGKTTFVEGTEIRVPLHRNLYVAEEAYQMPGTPSAEIIYLHKSYDTVTEFRKYASVADCARPETISHLVNQDGMLLMRACTKWAGSVEDGIAYLRGFDNIFIHPTCTNMAEEARLWSYKIDPLTTKVLRILKPGFEHGWDATRYGHESQVTRKLSIFDVL